MDAEASGTGSNPNQIRDETEARTVPAMVDPLWTLDSSPANLGSAWQLSEPFVDVDRRDWVEVRIFVSSSFSDFYNEREMLVNSVFPRLNDWCAGLKIRVVDVDLRCVLSRILQ
jgi:hypothetical protein